MTDLPSQSQNAANRTHASCGGRPGVSEAVGCVLCGRDGRAGRRGELCRGRLPPQEVPGEKMGEVHQ